MRNSWLLGLRLAVALILSCMILGHRRALVFGLSERAVDRYVEQIPLFVFLVVPLLASQTTKLWLARCALVLLVAVPAVEVVVYRYQQAFLTQHAAGLCETGTYHHLPWPWSGHWIVCTLDEGKEFILGCGD